jgi:hypothetical protein
VSRAARIRSRPILEGRIGYIASALLATGALIFPAASTAQTNSAVTDVTAVMPAAAADIDPGLCAPGDTPLCVGPYEAQIHLYSLSCAASGVFEDTPLPPGSPCGIDLSAFMVPSVEGLTKPSCLSSHTFTSDDAKAHGKPVNEVVAGGVARKMQLSYPAAVLGFRTAFGWVDGPDRDDDPVGDHSLVFSIQARPRESEDPEAPCITTPFTAAALTAVLRVFDGPAATSS